MASAPPRPILSVNPEAKPALSLVNEKLRCHCNGRAKIMQGVRSEIDGTVSEISQLTQPTRSRFMPNLSTNGKSTARRQRSTSRRLADGHGTSASRVLTNGMTTGLSSPSGEWFALKVGDKPEDQSFAAKEWLGKVRDVMYSFLSSSNFYEAAKTGYAELGLFGTEACFMEEHWKHGLVCHVMTFGEYWIAEGADKRPNMLLRYVPMTCLQIVERFVVDHFDSEVMHWDRVSTPIRVAYDTKNFESIFDILHLVEPNPAWDKLRKDFGGKPWRSVYWDPKSENPNQLLAIEGCFEQPFWAARWETAGGGDPWGTGPGWDALADLRALQLDAKRLGDGKDLALKPPLVGPSGVKVKMTPGSYTHASAVDKSAVQKLYEVPYQALEIIERGLQRYYGKIDEHFHVNLFMAITQMDGVQPRNNEEIFSRNAESMTQLGPVIERVNVEKLGVAVERAYGICMRLGLFPDPPEELHGQEVQIDFVSTLAKAQKAAGLGTMERSLGFLGNLKGVFPDITDNIDSDAIGREYWERTGAPIIGLRDPAAVEQIRQGRAQQEKMAQMQQSMPAAKDGAQAAALLAQTDLHGQPMLDRMMGGGAPSGL